MSKLSLVKIVKVILNRARLLKTAHRSGDTTPKKINSISATSNEFVCKQREAQTKRGKKRWHDDMLLDQHDSIENRATAVKHRPQQTPDNEMWLNDDRKYMPSPPMTRTHTTTFVHMIMKVLIIQTIILHSIRVVLPSDAIHK